MAAEIEKVGIYGGTFSPIHMGHVRAALAFLREMKLDRLYVIPAALPPHKAEKSGVGAEARLEMTRLAFADCPETADGRLAVSDFEVRREGKSYSIYTLEHFSRPDRRLYMLVGTDMFLTLPTWYRAEDIFRLADIVLMRRECDAQIGSELDRRQKEYANRFGARIHIIGERPLELSSTELRERIRKGLPVEGLIPAKTAEYIEKNSLYR